MTDDRVTRIEIRTGIGMEFADFESEISVFILTGITDQAARGTHLLVSSQTQLKAVRVVWKGSRLHLSSRSFRIQNLETSKNSRLDREHVGG
jgi:hypothetical protein